MTQSRQSASGFHKSLTSGFDRHLPAIARALSLSSCLALLGCSGAMTEDDLDLQLAELDQSLLNGTAVSANAQRASGLLTVLSAGERCAGVLLNSEFALTAEHCVDSPQQLPTITFLGQRVLAFDVRVPNTGQDIAILALNSNFDQALSDELNATPPPFSGDLADLQGATLTCVGTGATGIAPGGGLAGGGTLNTTTATVTGTGNFDYTLSGVAAPGDSGGPCFLDGILTGITSTTRFETRNGDVNGDGVTDVFDATRIVSSVQVGVSPFQDFIETAMEEMGRPSPTPTGPIFF